MQIELPLEHSIEVCEMLIQSNAFARISPAESMAIDNLINHAKTMNEELKVKVALSHPLAVVPKYATPGAAGFDLTVAEFEFPEDNPGWLNVNTGVRMEIPEGHGLFLFPRSGFAANYGLQLRNGVGVVDSDYRGDIKLMMQFKEYYRGALEANVFPGIRIAQGVILPTTLFAGFHVVDELETTERGAGGFGSTGA